MFENTEQFRNWMKTEGDIPPGEVKAPGGTKPAPGFDTVEDFRAWLHGPDEDLVKPREPEEPRGVVGEIGSALGAGVFSTAESISGAAEMIGVPGAETAREYWQEKGEGESLRRPEYLQEGTVLEHPERLGDWRWWTRSLGENLPNMAAMMLPGLGAMKIGQVAGWGTKAIRAAGLMGAFGGAGAIESGSAYNQAKMEMSREGIYSDIEIEQTATMEGITVGVVNALLEIMPFGNLFLIKQGAGRILKKIVRQGFIEGGTETIQEAVNVYVERLGHKPDQGFRENAGRILEAGIIGTALGGGAGGIFGGAEEAESSKLKDQRGKEKDEPMTSSAQMGATISTEKDRAETIARQKEERKKEGIRDRAETVLDEIIAEEEASRAEVEAQRAKEAEGLRLKAEEEAREEEAARQGMEEISDEEVLKAAAVETAEQALEEPPEVEIGSAVKWSMNPKGPLDREGTIEEIEAAGTAVIRNKKDKRLYRVSRGRYEEAWDLDRMKALNLEQEKRQGRREVDESLAGKKPWELTQRDYRKHPDAHQVPKGSIFSLDPTKVTPKDLNKYSNKELEALAIAFGAPHSGNKEKKVRTIMKAATVREWLRDATIDSLQEDYTLEVLKGYAQTVGSSLGPGTKKGVATGLIIWRNRARQSGAAAIADAQHEIAVQRAYVAGEDVSGEVLKDYQDREWFEEAEREEKEKAKEKPFLHDYSSTQVDLPAAEAKPVKDFGKDIPDEEIYTDPEDPSYGRAESPHITVKYGIHTLDPEKVRPLLEGQGAITAKLGKVSIFESDDYDVVKVNVESAELRALNKKIAENIEVTDTHPKYHPHVTVAYVKKGEGKKYVGNKSFEGKEITFESLVFSGKDGKTETFKLEGKEEKAEGGRLKAEEREAEGGRLKAEGEEREAEKEKAEPVKKPVVTEEKAALSTKAAAALKGLKVKIPVRIEETGKVVKVKEDALAAYEAVNKEIEVYRNLLECLSS